MKKCAFLLVSVFLIAVTTSGLSEAAESTAKKTTQEAETVELRLAHAWPTTHHIHKVIETWTDEIEEATEGRVKITIYSGGALSNANQLYDAVDTGVADMAWFLHGYTPGKFPRTSVLELPFMTDNAISASQALWHLYENYPGFKDEYGGVKMLFLWVTDVSQLMTNDKPVYELEDMAKLKLRVGSDSLVPPTKALGAEPNLMPIGDLYDSLQKGVVDGTILGTSAVNTFNLQEVIKYMTICNIHVSTMGVGISDEAWARISSRDQETIMELSGMRQSRITGENFYNEAKVGYDAATEGGVEIIELSDAKKENWEDSVSGVYEDWIENMNSKGIAGQDLFDEAVRLIEKYQE